MSDETAPWDSPAPSVTEVAPWDSPSPPSQVAAPRSFGSALAHEGAQTLKAGANAVMALPNMAADMGVAIRNIVGDAYNKLASNEPTSDYELPSTTWHGLMNDTFGAPENTVEKVNDVALPMLMGAAGASSGAPSAIRAMMGVPEVSGQVSPNFISPSDTKGQVLAQTLQKGQDLGLVVPPQTSNPSALHAAIETVGGKIATQQAASVHNQPIANSIAAKELGLNPDAPLTTNALRQVIKEAGKGYEAVRNVGPITVGPKYLQTLSDVADQASGPAASFPGSKVSPLVGEVDSLLQPSFDASHAVDKIAELRDASSVAFNQGDSRLSAGYKTLARALEDQIDEGISKNPDVDPKTVANFRASRVLAAKAHSVLDALNPATGDVSIQALAKSSDPLSGGLKTLGDFGSAVPKATQDVSKIGSHGVSHLDTLGTMFTGAFGEHVAGPWGMAAGAAYPAARWGAKAYALGPGQASAIPQAIEGPVSNPKAAAAAVQGVKALSDDVTARASGGKVDINSLVERLIKRWHAAKRETNKSTESLLKIPDATIVKALEVAQEHI